MNALPIREAALRRAAGDIPATFLADPLPSAWSPLAYFMPPLTATRRNGKLILEIDEQAFLAAATADPADNLQIVDRDRFLGFVSANIFTLTHDLAREGQRTSWWQRLSGALGKAAAATDQGVRRDAVALPTCGCDPEEHDGG